MRRQPARDPLVQPPAAHVERVPQHGRVVGYLHGQPSAVRTSTRSELGRERVAAGCRRCRDTHVHHGHGQRAGSGRLRDDDVLLGLPCDAGGTVQPEPHRVSARRQCVLIGQHSLEPQLTTRVGVAGLAEQRPAQGRPAVGEDVHDARLPATPEGPEAFTGESVVQQPGDVEGRDLRVGTHDVEAQRTLAAVEPLCFEEHVLREWIHVIQAVASPVGLEPHGHGAHQGRIQEVIAGTRLLVVAALTDDVHHAADAVLGQHVRLGAPTQTPQEGDGRWRMGHDGIGVGIAIALDAAGEAEVTVDPGRHGQPAGGRVRDEGAARCAGRFVTPRVLPFGATRVGHRPDGRLGIEPAAVEDDQARWVQVTDHHQAIDGVPEHGPVERLGEQAPHGHAGVVAVAQDASRAGIGHRSRSSGASP